VSVGGPDVLGAVLQVDQPLLGDGGGLVEVHQLVEGGELLGPQEVLAQVVLDDLEVLHIVLVPEGGGTGECEEDVWFLCRDFNAAAQLGWAVATIYHSVQHQRGEPVYSCVM
jgi:hypothetical protein